MYRKVEQKKGSVLLQIGKEHEARENLHREVGLLAHQHTKVWRLNLHSTHAMVFLKEIHVFARQEQVQNVIEYAVLRAVTNFGEWIEYLSHAVMSNGMKMVLLSIARGGKSTALYIMHRPTSESE